MKNKILVLSIFVFTLFNLSANAQTSVTSSGMSIQGIARDENNSALANFTTLELVFKIYYTGTGDVEETILTKTVNVTTDNFGVFSYVLDIDQNNYNLISSNSAYLRVTKDDVVFSDEKLQAVPYAIHAQNGVPTGSIMPFIGTVVPNGWLLCDGSDIPTDDYTKALRDVLGVNNTPNLQGLFLRGTGSADTGQEGPDLMVIQQDDFKSHLHDNGTLKTNNVGNHNHTTFIAHTGSKTGGGSSRNKLTINESGLPTTPYNSTAAGAHGHTVSGNTGSVGGTDTRPINYGVNYIIKL